MLQDVKIKAVSHDRGDGVIRQIGYDLPTISEMESNALNPPLYDTRKTEGETIEDRPGNATSTRLVTGQLFFLKHENSPSGLAQPVCGRSAGRTCPDDDDVVARHLL
jgi:hypothetical protein